MAAAPASSRRSRNAPRDVAAVPIIATQDPDFMLSFARGLMAIRAFGEGQAALSVGQVAKLSGLPRTSARRCLHTLVVLGYATAAGGRYALTPAMLALGQAYLTSTSVARVAQPILERVSEALDESSSVAVLDGQEIVYVARAATRRILSVNLSVGSRLPAACTSMGRVLVAALEDDARAKFLRRATLHQYTDRTITDRAALAAELDKVARQGFAVVDQELELGLRSCAVPIARPDGIVTAALNVGVHVSRRDVATLTRDVLPTLRRAASEISAALGAAPPHQP